ncbi:MAG: OadG family protein [Eubacteriales bacterium]|nr:OadG family protein [Eubacteriales bacterium]
MDLVNISLGTGAAVGLLGYCVVFIGLILLMLVVMALAKYFINKAKKESEAVPVKTAPAAEPTAAPAPKAPGSAGEIKLYDTDPRDAAMIMAIVADTMGKPINELRFKSIKEVKE